MARLPSILMNARRFQLQKPNSLLARMISCLVGELFYSSFLALCRHKRHIFVTAMSDNPHGTGSFFQPREIANAIVNIAALLVGNDAQSDRLARTRLPPRNAQQGITGWSGVEATLACSANDDLRDTPRLRDAAHSGATFRLLSNPHSDSECALYCTTSSNFVIGFHYRPEMISDECGKG